MLAYATSADQLDEVLKIAASTCLEILGKFAEGVIETFGDEYLRPPRIDELEQILQENEARGFPGCMGSIDCMHWAWKNCPKGWAEQFTSGKQGVPTIILEAVASKNLRIWHAFFVPRVSERHKRSKQVTTVHSSNKREISYGALYCKWKSI